MKLYSVIEGIKRICYTIPNVHTVIVGDVYDLNQLQDIEYSAMVITEQTHQYNNEDEYDVYGLNIFYVDRETSDKSNILDVHSHGIDALKEVVKYIEEIGGYITNQYTINTFEERFDSVCAGAYATINVRFQSEDCTKPKLVTSVNGMTGDVIIEGGVTEEELTEKLLLKQDVISDLDSIREGANKGKSAAEELVSVNEKIEQTNTDLTNLSNDLSQYKTEQSTIDESQNEAIEGLTKDVTDVESALNSKQDTLVSGTNIKTINGESVLGSGNIEINTDNFETKDNKITFIEDTATDTQYPSAKAVYNFVHPLYEETDNIVEEQTIQYQTIHNTILPQLNNLSTNKQDTLVSGENIKTVNGNSLLGSGNIEIKDTNIIDNLNSTSATDALSANMGRVLKEKVDEIELSKFPNVTIFGLPTIQQGQISDFSKDNYLQFPFLVDFHNQAFEIRMCFTTGNNVQTQENIFDSIDGLAFAVRGGHFVVAMSSDGQSWNMGEHIGVTNVLPNTTYYVKFSWNKLQYKLSVSIDNQTYTDDFSYTDTRSLYAKQIVIGKSTDNRYIFGGSINLNHCSLSIMGQEVWQGMDDAGLATRMATNMNNIDEEGKQVIKDIVGVNDLVHYDYIEEHYTPLTNFNNLNNAYNQFVVNQTTKNTEFDNKLNKLGEWYGTQAEFDALTEYDENIKYYIYD